MIASSNVATLALVYRCQKGAMARRTAEMDQTSCTVVCCFPFTDTCTVVTYYIYLLRQRSTDISSVQHDSSALSLTVGWPRCVILRQIRSTSKSLLYVLLKSPGLLQFPLIHWYTVRHDGYFIQRHAVITKCACMQVAVNTSAQFWGNFSGWLFNFNLCQTTSILAQFRVLKEPLNWWIWISTD